MGHVPHVYVAPPWRGDELTLPDATRHHIEKVLRRTGGELTYTDGAGTAGRGRLMDGTVARGEETSTSPPPMRITMMVAPPHRTDRARMVVEKLGELGVAELVWIRTANTAGRPPPAAKTAGWAVSALEQSRGDRLIEVSGTYAPLSDVSSVSGPSGVIYADPGGDSLEGAWEDSGLQGSGDMMIAVGPEGGFAPGEVPDRAPRLDLGERILRTETAATVAAGLALDLARRLG